MRPCPVLRRTSMTDLREQLQSSFGTAYTLERELSGGGMSRVFIAHDNSLGRKVVIKVLLPEFAATVNVHRFEREIQLAAKLQHPHIVPVHTAGVIEGLPYYTMPYIEGESLRARLARSGELPVHDVTRILFDVSGALDYAHEHGVVHRDIKPDNILLTGSHALVSDFGIAKALEASTSAAPSLTSQGVALGTPAYMSPEQAAGDGQIDHRADLYALGLVAYEMLAGAPPFAGRSSRALLAAHVVEIPEPLSARRPAAPPALSTLVVRLLEKRPADRPQSAKEVLRDLETALTSSAERALPSSHSALQPRGAQAIYVSVLLLLVLAGLIYMPRIHAAAALDPKRVAVIPFENRTGDPKFDPLGAITADWISRGLTETRLVDVADLGGRLPIGNAATAGFPPTGLEQPARDKAQISLFMETGAATIIAGSYYKQSDSLRFEGRVTDVKSGKLLTSVPPVVTSVATPMAGVAQIRERVMGSLATSFDSAFIKSDELAGAPPTYEAYQQYLKGNEAHRRSDFEQSVRYYMRAWSIDSTFALAAVLAATDDFYGGHCDRTDSVAGALERSRARLSSFDGAMLERQVAKCHGDWPAAYRAARKMMDVTPLSEEARILTAKASVFELNRPHEAIELLRAMDPARSRLGGSWIVGEYYDDLTSALHIVGKHSEELEAALQARRQYPNEFYARIYQMVALAALGQATEALQVMNDSWSLPETSLMTSLEDGVRVVASELRVHGHPDVAHQILQRYLAWLGTRPPAEAASDAHRASLARALYSEDKLAEARLLFRDLASAHPRNVDFLGALGLIAARTGNRIEAERISTRLDSMKAMYLNGRNTLQRARIAARLGDRAQAVTLLSEALSEGVPFDAYELHIDLDLAEPLRNYPGFEELLKPRG